MASLPEHGAACILQAALLVPTLPQLGWEAHRPERTGPGEPRKRSAAFEKCGGAKSLQGEGGPPGPLGGLWKKQASGLQKLFAASGDAAVRASDRAAERRGAGRLRYMVAPQQHVPSPGSVGSYLFE